MTDYRIDVETYSACDLAKEGAYKYSMHPSTKVLCVGFSEKNGVPRCEEPHKNMASKFIQPGNILHAWNAFFEICILRNVLKWKFPLEMWRCTMAKAAAAAMPLGLDDCAKRINLPAEFRKDAKGKTLIRQLCLPQKNGQQNKDAKLMEELKKYCIQDVVVETQLDILLKDLSDKEQAIWQLYLRMNLKGIPFDRQLVESAISLIEDSNAKLDKEINILTGGRVTCGTETSKIKKYLNLSSLAKTSYEDNKESLKHQSPDNARILQVRQERSRTSNSKYIAISRSSDSSTFRCRGALQHHGASTGRGAGRMVQPYNLPRSTISEYLINFLATKSLGYFEELGIDATKLLSQCLRQSIKAPEGYILTVGDYSSIEAIITAWVSGQEDTVEIFRTGGGKIYELAASQIYEKNIEDVTDKERQVGKVATLALGYQGGVGALSRMAEIYALDLTKLPMSPQEIVQQWRDKNEGVTKLWKKLTKNAINAISSPEVPFKCDKLTFKFKNNFLYIALPSGRLLSYFSPSIEEGDYGPQAAYKGYSTFNGAKIWTQQRVYGGKWMENIVQAISRDILTDAMMKLEDAKYNIILEVYDEIVCETKDDFGSLEEMITIMTSPPSWGKDIPLTVKGYREVRYRK